MNIDKAAIANVVLPMLIAFVLSAVTGHFLIPELIRMKAEQTERALGPKSHQSKTGTPNMGGIMIILAFTVTGLLFASRNPQILPVVFMTLGFGLVGFTDDFIKVHKRRSEGLTVKQKFLFQILIAVVFGLILVFYNHLSLDMEIPFAAEAVLALGVLSFPALVFISVAVVNATNLTDGVDGLLGCVTIAVTLFFTIAAVLKGQGVSAAGAAMIGAILGFLLYNANPARVFMGDTGSLAIGGFVVGMAYVLHLQLFIPIAGIIYVLEVVSVILQVGYFKATHGKRLFKMSPLHHHFELSGWGEVRVVTLFTVISVMASAVSLLALNF